MGTGQPQGLSLKVASSYLILDSVVTPGPHSSGQVCCASVRPGKELSACGHSSGRGPVTHRNPVVIDAIRSSLLAPGFLLMQSSVLQGMVLTGWLSLGAASHNAGLEWKATLPPFFETEASKPPCPSLPCQWPQGLSISLAGPPGGLNWHKCAGYIPGLGCPMGQPLRYALGTIGLLGVKR